MPLAKCPAHVPGLFASVYGWWLRLKWQNRSLAGHNTQLLDYSCQ